MIASVDKEGSTPTVSIVVTTFNRVDFLSETIDSILGQTYTDFEIIIVDNMSKDGTEEYVTSLGDPRIRYYRNANKGIIAVNRNLGIQMSRGKYIALCDDDDLWVTDKLHKQISIMETKPDVALCYTNAESFDGGRVVDKAMVKHAIKRNYFFCLLRSNYIPNSSVLIRSNVFQKLGLLNVDSSIFEDYEMWLRIAKEFPIYGIEDALIRYRLHANNMAGSRSMATLRAMRTIKGLNHKLNISWVRLQPYIVFKFLKFCFYRVTGR